MAGIYGLLVLAACSSLCLTSLIFTHRRYQKIAELSTDIDRVLHGNETVSFQKYHEGELYVLQDELSKMTVHLLEQAEALKKEKSYLADALADISHQLKTPLTSLNILSASLSREQVSEEQRLELVQEQVMLLARMEFDIRNCVVKRITALLEKRTEGIMGANRRNYYGECAAYIAALGEVRESLGEAGGKQRFMTSYKDKYSRRSAFREEMRNYGWIDTKRK